MNDERMIPRETPVVADGKNSAERMEAFRQLAAGVAHDFNSLLNVITADANLLLETHGGDPAVRESAHRIYAAGERAADLTQQLLIFTGLQPLQSERLEVNEILRRVASTFSTRYGNPIRPELCLAASLPEIDGDPDMLEKLTVNLVANACDGMAENGKLTITTDRVVVAEGASGRPPEARAGEFVRITFADDGAGIAAENLPHVFEPFFTTKDVGKGIGLGLPTVMGIATQHRGWVELESRVGAGTRVEVYLPVGPTRTVEGAAKVDAPNESGGGETILLVDDEALLREITVILLKKQGYRVLQAESGIDALEVWKWHGSRIQLLLTDMVMPDGLTGIELAAKLRVEKPQLKVIFTSAYSREMMGRISAPGEVVHFLQKPYRSERLSDLVRQVLDGKVAS
ncbi:MAG: multi-sensor hybrid histidine kinase [Verrucomicrobia bacterium]|nr:multi-sensor hybrid histidine kinase [Verrucomicrobiota bacterium]